MLFCDANVQKKVVIQNNFRNFANSMLRIGTAQTTY